MSIEAAVMNEKKVGGDLHFLHLKSLSIYPAYFQALIFSQLEFAKRWRWTPLLSVWI